MINFPVNMSEEERRLLGRAAFESDQSVGGFIRHYFVRGLALDRPELAKAIIEARRRRKGITLLVAMGCALWLTMGGEDLQMRRPTGVRAGARREGMA